MPSNPSGMSRTSILDSAREPGIDLGRSKRNDIAGTQIDQHPAADQGIGRGVGSKELAIGIHDEGGIEQVLHETITGS